MEIGTRTKEEEEKRLVMKWNRLREQWIILGKEIHDVEYELQQIRNNQNNMTRTPQEKLQTLQQRSNEIIKEKARLEEELRAINREIVVVQKSMNETITTT